jgi:hypothetical protein
MTPLIVVICKHDCNQHSAIMMYLFLASHLAYGNGNSPFLYLLIHVVISDISEKGNSGRMRLENVRCSEMRYLAMQCIISDVSDMHISGLSMSDESGGCESIVER